MFLYGSSAAVQTWEQRRQLGFSKMVRFSTVTVQTGDMSNSQTVYYLGLPKAIRLSLAQFPPQQPQQLTNIALLAAVLGLG